MFGHSKCSTATACAVQPQYVESCPCLAVAQPESCLCLVQVVKGGDAASCKAVVHSLGLFDDRLKGLVAITQAFLLGSDAFAVDLDATAQGHKIRGVGAPPPSVPPPALSFTNQPPPPAAPPLSDRTLAR